MTIKAQIPAREPGEPGESLPEQSNTEQLAIPVPEQPWRSPLGEPCHKCGAAAGEPCTANGVAGQLHAPRPTAPGRVQADRESLMSQSTYITANGERRYTVSVTLNEDQLWDLDQLARALDAEWVAMAATELDENYRRHIVAERPRKRSDALREAIRRTLETIG